MSYNKENQFRSTFHLGEESRRRIEIHKKSCITELCLEQKCHRIVLGCQLCEVVVISNILVHIQEYELCKVGI